MDLVSHVAKEHHLEYDDWNVQFHSTPKGEKYNENSNFIIRQSELDEDLKLVQGFVSLDKQT